jgi:hypothetical protein
VQQQGIKMDTAHKKIDEPVGDLWLLIAEIIRQDCFEGDGGVASCGLADTASTKTTQ